MEVRVEFLLENPPRKEGQLPDPAAAGLERRVYFFDDFSCFKLRLHSKSERLLDEQRNHIEPCALLAQRLLVRRRGETAGSVEHLREEMNVAHS